MQHLMGYNGNLGEILRVYDVSPKETCKCHLRYILCNCKPGASNQQELSLAYVTAKTQLTGWSTPCTDGLIIFPPLLMF